MSTLHSDLYRFLTLLVVPVLVLCVTTPTPASAACLVPAPALLEAPAERVNAFETGGA